MVQQSEGFVETKKPYSSANRRMEYDNFKVAPVSGALGAEVEGIDISSPLSDAVIADIRQALLDHLSLIHI